MCAIRRSHPALLLIVGLALALSGCAPATGDLGTLAPAPTAAAPSLPASSPEATPGSTSDVLPPASASTAAAGSPAGTTTVRAYFLMQGTAAGRSGFVPVLREVPQTSAVATAALTQLLAGPNAAEAASDPIIETRVAPQTRLLGLTIENGVATVDLSKEFVAGGGMSVYLIAEVGQVVFTLTQFPTVDGVRFEIDDTATAVATDHGLVSTRPVTRKDFTTFLPAIWVDRPAWGGVLANPARIVGLANVFEAQFRVAIIGESGLVLTDKPITASCGTGCLGTFDATLPYAASTAQRGTLRVYDVSMQDGSRRDVVDYPVWLTPS